MGALLDAGYPAEQITAIERHYGIFQATCQHFTRILMTPPLVTATKHVAAALKLLNDAPGATLIALVPSTFEHTDAEELERLPADTLAIAKVWTKMIQVAR